MAPGSILKKRAVLLAILAGCSFLGCRSDPARDAALPEARENEANAPPNAQADSRAETTDDQEKEKVLDLAIKMSGKKFSSDERNIISRMLSLNENDLVKGLHVFAEISNGRYPSRLDAKTAIKETSGLGANWSGIPKEEQKKRARDIFFAAAYYEKLAREKKDVTYYGDEVTFGDSGKVLMRWKLSKDEYRVIFGDLSGGNISGERLAELEKGLAE